MGINQAFTSYSNPKGKADTERFMRTLNVERAWINAFTSPGAFLETLDRRIDGSKANSLHSTLGYRSPEVSRQNSLATRRT